MRKEYDRDPAEPHTVWVELDDIVGTDDVWMAGKFRRVHDIHRSDPRRVVVVEFDQWTLSRTTDPQYAQVLKIEPVEPISQPHRAFLVTMTSPGMTVERVGVPAGEEWGTNDRGAADGFARSFLANTLVRLEGPIRRYASVHENPDGWVTL